MIDFGSRVIDADEIHSLVRVLRADGRRVIAPTVRDDAIVYDEIQGANELPQGIRDVQEAGRYRLEQTDDGAFFGFNVGPHAWRRFLQPPEERLWTVDRDLTVVERPPDPAPTAFLGVRACELRAIQIQDGVLTRPGQEDPGYSARRASSFIIAVNCGRAGGTCFCTSMGTGPAVSSGFDLALTEIIEPGPHRFLVEVGTESGAALLQKLDAHPASPQDEASARACTERAAASMGRAMDPTGLPALLAGAPEAATWDAVAERCLTCANCTMVCPTCFCTSIEDTAELTGEHAERWQRWDSCFSVDFTLLHGGSVRTSATARYRHWLTHKLSSWVDQFGSSGCVGCGRCITWCPTGIDLTEVVTDLRRETQGGVPS